MFDCLLCLTSIFRRVGRRLGRRRRWGSPPQLPAGDQLLHGSDNFRFRCVLCLVQVLLYDIRLLTSTHLPRPQGGVSAGQLVSYTQAVRGASSPATTHGNILLAPSTSFGLTLFCSTSDLFLVLLVIQTQHFYKLNTQIHELPSTKCHGTGSS